MKGPFGSGEGFFQILGDSVLTVLTSLEWTGAAILARGDSWFCLLNKALSHSWQFLEWSRKLSVNSVVCISAKVNLHCQQLRSLEKAMTTYSNTLTWKNPMFRGAWQAAVHGVAKSQTRLSDFTFTFHFHSLEKEMATHSSVLAWRIPGTGEPGGLPSMGSHRVGHD